ncbi:hypothetical protein [Brachyspira murdochii]|uniref:Uncharacterized protein n=1 Tax=Brachyspira murdochii (strain ATCC 51284 / DSM 12563 / 56-150) TaxID=526224 RepID=D5U979_BRAM5|nr:hypothetical protein [Brachyspira murdochii]ADG71252.1 hypothetical protein Bmur_1158 [Brachyspira murdochii DSM 12563]
MSEKKKHPNNEADMVNPNKGFDGNNIRFDKNQGNIGWQKNPLNPASQKNNDDKK